MSKKKKNKIVIEIELPSCVGEYGEELYYDDKTLARFCAVLDARRGHNGDLKLATPEIVAELLNAGFLIRERSKPVREDDLVFREWDQGMQAYFRDA